MGAAAQSMGAAAVGAVGSGTDRAAMQAGRDHVTAGVQIEPLALLAILALILVLLLADDEDRENMRNRHMLLWRVQRKGHPAPVRGEVRRMRQSSLPHSTASCAYGNLVQWCAEAHDQRGIALLGARSLPSVALMALSSRLSSNLRTRG